MSEGSVGKNQFEQFSDAMSTSAETAGRSVVMVNARRRMPASGIAYTDNLILTADHVLEKEEDITVMLPGADELVPAVIAGRDPARDIALLRLEEARLTPAVKADAPARVGQLVLALARPDGSLQASLGVVSAAGGPVHLRRGRVLEQYIRTDAIPFPGFSGGPLVDASGRVLGLNTSGLNTGTLISIPTAVVWEAAANLAEHGAIRRGYLGIRSQVVRLSETQRQNLPGQQAIGLLVVSLEENSPAERGGLMVGDIITAIAGQPIQDHDDLQVHLGPKSIGAPLQVDILRGGSLTNVQVTIGERN
jgi:S1-C subfamily serine protease